jgi:TP53 regulating kinase-like protein
MVKRGAEADIFLVRWFEKTAISKVRTRKSYRNSSLDNEIRTRRTVREANMISNAKLAGVISPFIYFVDPVRAEIIMEFVDGENVRDTINSELAKCIGRYAGLLHASNIIHGDLTTANFIFNKQEKRLTVIDFGLSYYSERLEDRAVDIRLIKEIFNSAYSWASQNLFHGFITGYSGIINRVTLNKTLRNVSEIENRGRYARAVC